jgi:1-phosphofructokinase family hexose kinase
MILALCPNPSIDKQIFMNRLLTGSVNKSRKEIAFPGGKGVHVALALSELNEPVVLGGFWGGPTGKWIQKECGKRNIQTIGPEVEEWTRTCLTIISDEEPNESEIIEKGPKISSVDYDSFIEDVNRLAPSCQSIIVSGSWPPSSSLDSYLHLQKICKKNNLPLWVDASGKRLKEAIKVRPFGIHVNVKEAKNLFKSDISPQNAASKLLDFCQVAAVTDGANGLFLAKKNNLIHTRCFVEQVISTVGSGDCLTAGLVLGWVRGLNLQEIANLATACGSANCVHPELGMLKKDDVYALLPKVQSINTAHQ